MTKPAGLFNAIKTLGFSALADFDPENEEHVLAVLVLSGDEDDLSSLKPHVEKLRGPLKTRVLADCDPDVIDEAFEASRYEALENLIRVGLDWEHPNLSNAPEELLSWMTLDDERIYTLRGDEFSEEHPPSIGCSVDPQLFAKQIWHGDATMDWTEDRMAVADVLCRLNSSSWVIALAILAEQKESDAFQIAAEAAIFSAAAASTAENSNAFYHAVASGDSEHDEAFDLIYAAIEDVDEQEVLIQGASVEILSQRNIEHPPIDGAYFSGSNYDDNELRAAQKMMKRIDNTPSEKMQKARLYADIMTTDFVEKDAFIKLFPVENSALCLFLGDDKSLFESACGDDFLALGAIEIILQNADISTCLKLIEACSLYRVDYVRNRLAFILN